MIEEEIGEIQDELRACRHQIEALRALKDEHNKDYETLKEDVHQLVELVWLMIHRMTNQGGIDPKHGEMARLLAEKHGVVSAGIQE